MSEHTPPERSNDLPPTGEVKVETLGRYRILSELGRGGCGVVYRALDPSIGRVVAIKTILAKESSGSESRERFRREARSAGNLSHPNIVTVHDFSDTGDPMFIAMEFIEGRTLAEFMSSGPLAPDFALRVLRSAADALDYAHSHHIVHRDVKPANFLIATGGRLKITDFGIAKMLDGDQGLTSTGMLVGTAQYMSPEQVSEGTVTGRSDQFSLAVIAYEMLTGVKPFQGNSWASVIHAIIMADPPPVARYRDSYSDTVDRVLHKALAKEPEARYQTCMAFCEDLERGILGVTVEHTAILARPQDVSSAPTLKQQPATVPVTQPHPVTTNVAPEVPQVVAKSAAWKPLMIGAAGGAVIAGGLWLGLRSKPTPSAPPLVVAQQPSVAQQPIAVAPQTAPSSQPVPVPPPAVTPAKQIAKQTKPAAPPERTPQQEPAKPAPSTVPTATPTPAPPVVTQAPPPPAPVPVKPQEDQTKRIAAEQAQAKQAADEQARRLAEEQTKRAADEQAKRDEQAKLAAAQARDEQVRKAVAADNAAISRALADYRSSYERKDLAALRAIWPSIPKQMLDEIRSSFRDASEVSMDLRPVGDPKIAGTTATVLCDRNLRQVILKRALQASSRVRIVLSRAAGGWVIQSVDPVNQ